MQIEIPEDQVPPDLTDAAIRALITYASIDRPGSSLEVEQKGNGGHAVRVRPNAEHYEVVTE